MRVLLVKLSSLGDVIHTLPVVQDLRQALPGIEIDWVVEPAFASVLEMHPGLSRIIPCALRQWRRARFNAKARLQMREFWTQLTQVRYDCVFDLQGLSKSAVVARLAKLTPAGVRYAMANRTLGSSYEPLTRWLADRAIVLKPQLHALERSRWLCAKALGYSFSSEVDFGLVVPPVARGLALANAELDLSPSTSASPKVAFLMGTSRADKTWPEDHWVELARRFNASGLEVCLVHGSESELQSCQRVAQQVSRAVIWPRCTLVELAQRLEQTVGSVGVDSGPSHLSVALDLVHVQIYRFDTAWRTGPMAQSHGAYQHSVLQLHGAKSLGDPTLAINDQTSSWIQEVDEVWRTWGMCCAAKTQRSVHWRGLGS